MEKPSEVVITQITASSVGLGQPDRSVALVLGLGDDQQVYVWARLAARWELYRNQG